MKPKLSSGIRWALSSAWIVLMWPHAHWTVSLTVALLVVSNEMATWVSEAHGAMLRTIAKLMQAHLDISKAQGATTSKYALGLIDILRKMNGEKEETIQ